MSDVEAKICSIYILSEQIVNEPLVSLRPRVVNRDHVADSARQIGIFALEVLDKLPGSPQ
jgi:hypothetical protein